MTYISTTQSLKRISKPHLGTQCRMMGKTHTWALIAWESHPSLPFPNCEVGAVTSPPFCSIALSVVITAWANLHQLGPWLLIICEQYFNQHWGLWLAPQVNFAGVNDLEVSWLCSRDKVSLLCFSAMPWLVWRESQEQCDYTEVEVLLEDPLPLQRVWCVVSTEHMVLTILIFNTSLR